MIFSRLKALLIGSARSQPSGDGERAAASDLGARLERAKADFEAAVRIWPRDASAIERSWRQLRDAKCAQLRAEMGR